MSISNIASAQDVFYQSTRTDLIFKLLYLESLGTAKQLYYRNLYLESIKYFNSFHEKNPPKRTPADFLNSFNSLHQSILSDGLQSSTSFPLTSDGEPFDAAHRLSCAAYLDLNIPIHTVSDSCSFNYQYFRSRAASEMLLSVGAYEFLKRSKYSYVVNIHSCVDSALDAEIEDIFARHHCKYYFSKSIYLTIRGYHNLKKITYYPDDWLGSATNEYSGAYSHAANSFGPHPLRFIVVVSSSHHNVTKAKTEIRDLVGLGNFSIHTTDTAEESVRLAQHLLFPNSVSLLNDLPPAVDISKRYPELQFFLTYLRQLQLDTDDYCLVGSYPMHLLACRSARDVDYICTNMNPVPGLPDPYSLHDEPESLYYSGHIHHILNPSNFMYLEGLKIMSPSSLLLFKANRQELPKDINDLSLLLHHSSSSLLQPSISSIKRRSTLRKLLSYILNYIKNL